MSETYENDELFVYVNGDRWELGQVKCPNNTGDGYFCWYSTGDTAANTPVTHMHKLANAGWSHVERDSDKRIELDCKFGKLTCEIARDDGEYREFEIDLYTNDKKSYQVAVIGTNEYRGTRGVPESIRTLIEDAEAIELMLKDLDERLAREERS